MRVWDCFYVNDELDLLEFRLNYLSASVDRVLVVEADRTFSGQPKALNVSDNLHRFAAHSGRMTVLPVALPVVAGSAWEREYAQRSFLGARLRELLLPEDVAVVGDVDEVFDHRIVQRLRQGLTGPLRLSLTHANYYANWCMKTPWDLGPIAFTSSMVEVPAVAHLLGDSSHDHESRDVDYLESAGWHLSFTGGADQIRSKLRAYSHQDFAVPAVLAPGHIERCMRYGTAITGFHVLQKLGPDELDGLQSELRAALPELFAFQDKSSPIRAHAYAAYAFSITHGKRSMVLTRAFELAPALTFYAALPLLLGLDTARRFLRKVRRSRQAGRLGIAS